MAEELKIKVDEAYKIDVGRSIARLSSIAMKELNINSGDFISIKGKNEALAIAWKCHPEDEHEGIIRIDSTLRTNADVSLDDKVIIKKINCKEAQSITIAPIEHNIKYDRDPTSIFLNKLIDKPYLKGNQITLYSMGTPLYYAITSANPKGPIVVTDKTKLTVSENPVSQDSLKISDVTYEDIGGLHDEIDQIREMIELPMKHPEVFERLGIGAPKGVLLTGPPGTGKTLLARAVASETESNFFSINGPEIMSKFYGESEKQIRDIFEKAEKESPSVIFIDEIDSIAPKREETQGETERRIVAQLLTLMDGLKSRGHVIVIAATNRPDAIDPALRRPGRFDREISINPPDKNGRKEIMQVHTRGMPLAQDVDLDKISEMTIAYTGADLEVLCKEAAMKSLRNWIPDLKNFDEKLPINALEKIDVKMQHFIEAFRKVEPSAMREVLIKKPTTKWSDIGGLNNVKETLKEIIEWPLSNPDYFKEVGIKPAKGVLMHGPPGTGKTLLAKAIANEADANFISVKGPELISKWVGESEKQVRKIFKKARQVAPSVIFFDEFDSIASVRNANSNEGGNERVVNQLLTELDGVEELSGVVVIAATNRVDLIDPALIRPGRFDEIVEIPLPDEKSREKIFEVHAGKMPVKLSNEDIKEIIQKTDGMSGADIENICREAGMVAIRAAKNKNKSAKNVTIKLEDFNKALDKIKNKIKERQATDCQQNYIA
jgi:transitional endoplasmic reticulum ATPase